MILGFVPFANSLVLFPIANLHITTLGHGYTSYEHVPHEGRSRSLLYLPRTGYSSSQ